MGLISEAGTLRVKPDAQLMRVGDNQQTSCCSMNSWSASAEQQRGGGGGGQDVQLAGVDLGLVMLQTVGEEMAKIQGEEPVDTQDVWELAQSPHPMFNYFLFCKLYVFQRYIWDP